METHKLILLRPKPTFKLSQFTVAVFDHFFYPWSILWILPRDGFCGLANRRFLPSIAHLAFVEAAAGNGKAADDRALTFRRYYRGNEQIIWELGSGLARAAAQVLLITSWAQQARIAFEWPTVLMLEASWLMKFAVISIKYGYMTSEEYSMASTAPYAEFRRFNDSIQVITSFAFPNLAVYTAELERVSHALRPLSIDAEGANLRLDPSAVARMRARLAYDVNRLRFDDHFLEELSAPFALEGEEDAESEDAPRYISVAAMVFAVRLAAHPIKGVAAKLVHFRTIRMAASLLTLAFVLLPFLAAHAEATDTFPDSRLVWLLPYVCGCDFRCDPACGCVPLEPTLAVMLVLVVYPLYKSLLGAILFLSFGVLEATRRQRSISIWGRLLQAGNWPVIVDEEALRAMHGRPAKGSGKGSGKGGGCEGIESGRIAMPTSDAPSNAERSTEPRDSSGRPRSSSGSSSGGRRRKSSGDSMNFHKSGALVGGIELGGSLMEDAAALSASVGLLAPRATASAKGSGSGGGSGGGSERGSAKRLSGNKHEAFADENGEEAEALDAVLGEPPPCADQMLHLCDLPMARPPSVQLQTALNVRSWEIGRAMLFRFGEHYRARIDTYMGLFLLTLVLMVVSTGVSFIFSKVEEANVQLVLGVMVGLSLMLGPALTAMLLVLVTANAQNGRQRALLANIALGLHQKLSRTHGVVELATAASTTVDGAADASASAAAPSPATARRRLSRRVVDDEREWSAAAIEQRRRAADAIGDTISRLQDGELVHPVQILGVPASWELVTTFASLLAVSFSLVSAQLVRVFKLYYEEFFRSGVVFFAPSALAYSRLNVSASNVSVPVGC